MTRLKPPRTLALGLALALATAGCFSFPPRDSREHSAPRPNRPAPRIQRPTPPSPRLATESALARGPALRLNDTMLDSEQNVLEKLQDTLTALEDAKAAGNELRARLGAAEQAKAAEAVKAQDLARQVAQLTQALETKTVALEKARADLTAAQTTAAALEPNVEKLKAANAQAATLAAKLKEAETANESLGDQLIKADLARVKAQQDLVALQIHLARQRALTKLRARQSQAQAPATSQPPSQEASP